LIISKIHDSLLRGRHRVVLAEERSETVSGGPLGGRRVAHLTLSLATRPLLTNAKPQARRPASQPLPPHRLRKVIQLMAAGHSEELDLEALALESGYSRGYFLQMFRAATGYTPHQYLIRLRLEKARSLIDSGAMSFIDIARECGFCSHSHFTRAFRQIVGVTPSEYRRQG
jgi:AraC family transcriptional regulator